MEAVMEKIEIDRYPAYKKLDAAWLGEIPAQWECSRMKYLFRDVSVKGKPNAELLSVTQDQGVVPRTSVENRMVMPSGNLESFKYIEKGDFAISLRSFEGGLEYCHHDGIISPAYTVLKPQTAIESRYYKYLFKSFSFISELQTSVVGIREGKNISYQQLCYSILPIPSKKEQTAIANFLDHKTALTDKAIAQKERLIELLKERRQILIHKAVTRGLDPNVKMKDSGVEWIGEIPEHWEVKALKHIAYLQSGETISAEKFVEEGYPVYGGNGFRGFASTYTNDGEFALIGRQGALCGNINYGKGKFFASEHAIVVYPLNNENYFWLGEIVKVADFNRLSQSAAQPGIAISVIKNILFPYPPLDEQREISLFLNDVYSTVDKVISLQMKEIEKLSEFKATLIDAAVTGKIKLC